MIRINRETDYGVVILSLMALEPERRFNAPSLAEQRNLPLPMVSKILKQLAKAGLLVSYRGAKGGYGLARSPEQINVAEIIAALEGPIALTECVSAVSACQYHGLCVVSSNWSRINKVLLETLQGVSLMDMTRPITSLPGMPPPVTALNA